MNPIFSKFSSFINFLYNFFLETVKLSDNYNIYSRIGTITLLLFLIILSIYKTTFFDVIIFTIYNF